MDNEQHTLVSLTLVKSSAKNQILNSIESAKAQYLLSASDIRGILYEALAKNMDEELAEQGSAYGHLINAMKEEAKNASDTDDNT